MYTAKNRTEIVNRNIVVASIDRVKLTYQLSGKVKHRNPLNPEFRSLPVVKPGRSLEIGLYYGYRNKQGDESLVWVASAKLDATESDIRKKYKEIKKPAKQIQRNGVTYRYCYKKEITHKEYIVKGFRNIRFSKNKSYIRIELNDVIQKQINETIFTHARRSIQYLLAYKVFIYGTKSAQQNNSRRRALYLMKSVKISEIELAFDITYKYGKQFYDRLLELVNQKNPDLNKYKNTIYSNNSFDKNKRAKWKFYNRSLKDRFDNGDSSEKHELGDVYRFEITIGRNIVNSHNVSMNDLKQKQAKLIEQLEKPSSIMFTKFFELFDIELVRSFIKDIQIIDGQLNPKKTPKKQVIKTIKQLLLSRAIDKVN